MYLFSFFQPNSKKSKEKKNRERGSVVNFLPREHSLVGLDTIPDTENGLLCLIAEMFEVSERPAPWIRMIRFIVLSGRQQDWVDSEMEDTMWLELWCRRERESKVRNSTHMCRIPFQISDNHRHVKIASDLENDRVLVIDSAHITIFGVLPTFSRGENDWAGIMSQVRLVHISESWIDDRT
jgi:hypothetical protein